MQLNLQDNGFKLKMCLYKGINDGVILMENIKCMQKFNGIERDC